LLPNTSTLPLRSAPGNTAWNETYDFYVGNDAMQCSETKLYYFVLTSLDINVRFSMLQLITLRTVFLWWWSRVQQRCPNEMIKSRALLCYLYSG
jgi:hypothetical protein